MGKGKKASRASTGGLESVRPTDLCKLESLKTLFVKKVANEVSLPYPIYILITLVHLTLHLRVPRSHTIVSSNLNLTPEQQQSRSQVPLPYAHEGISQKCSHSSYGLKIFRVRGKAAPIFSIVPACTSSHFRRPRFRRRH